MEQQQQQGGGEAGVNVASEAGQHHQQQRQHSEWVPVGRDPPGSTTLLGPFGTMAELANVGAAGGEAAVRDALAKPVPAATATAATEWLPAAPAPAPAPAAGYMEMGAMSDFEILAHDKGDESDYSPVGVRPELAMPKNWMRELEAQKEAFHGDASPPSVPRATPPGERFPPAAGLSDVDLSRPAGSPRSDDDDEGPQIESCDSSPADDMVGEFPARSGLSPGGPVAAGPPGGPPSGKTSPSDDGPPKKASSPDKPMEKLIFLAEEKYLETAAPQKRERDGPGDAETLAKNPRKDERAEAPGPRGAHAGEKPPVVYHPGYSEAETISISQESSPLEEISPISEEFTDKLIVASDEAQKRQPSTEMEYSISLSQESSPGEDASPVVGDLGRTFPKPSAAAAQQRQPAGTDVSEEKQVPLAKKDNSLTSSYVSSSTEESSPGEERAGGEAGGRKFGDKEDFVEEVPRQARDIPAAAKTGDGGGEKPWASARRDAERAEPALAAESLGPARGGGGDWFAEPPSSVADAGWRAVDVAADKAPVVPPSRGSVGGGGGGWRAEEPAGEKSSADTGVAGALAACRAVPAAPPPVPPAPPLPAAAVVRARGTRAGAASGQSFGRLADDEGSGSPREEFDETYEEPAAGRVPTAPSAAEEEDVEDEEEEDEADEEEEERERLEAATKAAICAVRQAAREPGSGRASEGHDAVVAADERNLVTGEEEREVERGAAGRDAASRAVEGSMQELSRALEKMKGDSRLAIEEVLQQQEEGAAGRADTGGEAARSEEAGRGGPWAAEGRVPGDGAGEGAAPPGDAKRAAGPLAARRDETAAETEAKPRVSDTALDGIGRASGELKQAAWDREARVATKDDASSSLTETTAQNAENCARAAAAAAVATETRPSAEESRPSGDRAVATDRRQDARPGGETHGAGLAEAQGPRDGCAGKTAPGAAGRGTADDLMGFDTGSGKQQQQPPPQQQPPAATVSFTALGAPPSSGVRVVDSDDDEEEEEEEDDDDEYENEFYTEDVLTSPWVDKSLVPLAEEEEVAKPDKTAAAATPTAPTAPRAPEPGPRAAVPVQPRASPAAPASGPPVPPARIAVTPAASAAEEEEAKGARPSQPSPSWPGFGPPTVIIEEAAEEGVAEREEPRGGAAARDAREESQQQQQQEEKEEEKLPVKVEEGPARPTSLLDKVHIPTVTQLVYWRDPRRSGAVLVALLLLLLSIARLSVFTIVGYLGLLVLMCTITWRVGRGVLCAVQKRDDGHPFRAYLAEDVNVTRDRMSRQVEAARVWTTGAATELRRLLLVQDLVDSLKFAGVLWLMTYVGSVFNGLSLLILGVVLLFSVPIAYEKKKTEVDHYLALVQAKVDEATARVKSVIPAALRPNEPNSTVAAK